MGGSGFPTPSFSATNFVSYSMLDIESFLTREFLKEYDLVESYLDSIDYGGKTILNRVEDYLVSLGEEDYQAGTEKFLEEIKLANRNYVLYITKTGKLGFKLRWVISQ